MQLTARGHKAALSRIRQDCRGREAASRRPRPLARPAPMRSTSAPNFDASALQGGDAEDRRALAHMQAGSAGGKTAAKPPAALPAAPQLYPCAPAAARFFPREPVPKRSPLRPKATLSGDQCQCNRYETACTPVSWKAFPIPESLVLYQSADGRGCTVPGRDFAQVPGLSMKKASVHSMLLGPSEICSTGLLQSRVGVTSLKDRC